jgi:hypothetical protein
MRNALSNAIARANNNTLLETISSGTTGSRTARWVDRLNEFLSVAVARDAMLPGRKTG